MNTVMLNLGRDDFYQLLKGIGGIDFSPQATVIIQETIEEWGTPLSLEDIRLHFTEMAMEDFFEVAIHPDGGVTPDNFKDANEWYPCQSWDLGDGTVLIEEQ